LGKNSFEPDFHPGTLELIEQMPRRRKKKLQGPGSKVILQLLNNMTTQRMREKFLDKKNPTISDEVFLL
jgi:hypothetical protein